MMAYRRKSWQDGARWRKDDLFAYGMLTEIDLKKEPLHSYGEASVSEYDAACLALWQRVLVQAIHDFDFVMRCKRRPGLLATAGRGYPLPKCMHLPLIQWFFSKGNDVGSFRWVCDYIGLDPVFVLKRMQKRFNIITHRDAMLALDEFERGTTMRFCA